MQHGGAMAVERPLRVAGGAGGVAQGRAGPLVELRPVELIAVLSDQLVIDAGHRQRCRRLAQQYEAAVFGKLRRQALDQRNEARVEKEQAIGGMVDDVDDLVIKQPRVDRVTNGTNARDAVIQLKMAEGIPSEGAYPIAGLDAEPQQGPGELL
jgi:hypothetical protein